jgi:5-methylcytosine-specific restriction enzyme subunit McrC
MRTDTILKSRDRVIIIDTKYYKETLVKYKGGHPKIRSDHLYQIMSYIHNRHKNNASEPRQEGILLYPVVGGANISLSYNIDGFKVGVETVDLSNNWLEIHNELLSKMEKKEI